MIVSFEKAFLFVHVPKTAGTSMRQVLSKHAHSPDKFWTNRLLGAVGIPINYCLGDYQHYRFRIHEPVRRVVNVYPPDVIERLYKFAFVRNPWDLLVSYRNFIRATPGHKRYRRVVKLDFEEFLKFAIAKRFGQQSQLLTDRRGQLLVDFVGRFENLQQDFQMIARRLEIPAQLPHYNRTANRDYREQYTRRTRELVRAAYARDIEAFAYEFDSDCDTTPTRAA